MRWLGLSLALAIAAPCAAAGCYSTGDGTSPPPKQLYFPVGMAVSRFGNVLYVVNSDFDLQWNGGTLQSYDLHLIRRHTAVTILNPNKDPSVNPYDPTVPLVRPPSGVSCDTSVQNPPVYKTDGSGQRQPLGETCAPPVNSSTYVRDSAIIGAFATDLQIAVPRPQCVGDSSATQATRCDDVMRCDVGNHCELTGGRDRLFAPVRGDASLTWADLVVDEENVVPRLPSGPDDAVLDYGPFRIDCGTRANNRCAADHHAGTDPNIPAANTRHVTMPGEPFGMAQSATGDSIVITHQTDTKTSLFSTGIPGGIGAPYPSLQFILDGVVTGGNGIFAVPHDLQAFDRNAPLPNEAFLQTSRSSTEIDLLRFYGDDGSTLARPFLVKEATYSITTNASGTDSRGLVIDPTPRIACKAAVKPVGPGRTQSDVDREIQRCARLPARVFIANRSPASMLVGEIGEASASGDGSYDPDRLVLFGTVPLSLGPSRLFMAPVVDAAGNYALRVFIVCFDSATIYVYDPDLGVVENVIHTGAGPFAMTFDPFDLTDVALHRPVPMDARDPDLGLRRYRFGYIASFTNSFVQVLDLDNARPTNGAPPTYENIVYTLGVPTLPKGSQ